MVEEYNKTAGYRQGWQEGAVDMKQQENKLKEDLIKVELEHKRYIQMDRDCTAKNHKLAEEHRKCTEEHRKCTEEHRKCTEEYKELRNKKKSYEELEKERDSLLLENQRYRKKYFEKGVTRRCEKCDTVLAYVKK